MNKKTRGLNRLNRELDKELNEENSRVMTDMICYIRSADLSPYQQETIRSDLLSMVLAAQERGEGISAVIGGDYKAFCDEIIASAPPIGTREKTLELLDTVVLCTAVLAAIDLLLSPEIFFLIQALVEGRAVHPEMTITWGSLLKYVALTGAACALVQYISRNSFELTSGNPAEEISEAEAFRDKKKQAGRRKRFALGAAGGLGLAAVFLISIRLDDYAIVKLPMVIMLVVVVVLFGIHKMLNLQSWGEE